MICNANSNLVFDDNNYIIPSQLQWCISSLFPYLGKKGIKRGKRGEKGKEERKRRVKGRKRGGKEEKSRKGRKKDKRNENNRFGGQKMEK